MDSKSMMQTLPKTTSLTLRTKWMMLHKFHSTSLREFYCSLTQTHLLLSKWAMGGFFCFCFCFCFFFLIRFLYALLIQGFSTYCHKKWQVKNWLGIKYSSLLYKRPLNNLNLFLRQTKHFYFILFWCHQLLFFNIHLFILIGG